MPRKGILGGSGKSRGRGSRKTGFRILPERGKTGRFISSKPSKRRAPQILSTKKRGRR